MADENAAPAWPDASKPGVPLHPDRDGWHWIVDELYPQHKHALRWTAAKGWQENEGMWGPASDYGYLGPCLTPAEVAAASEQAAERRGIERAMEALAGGLPTNTHAFCILSVAEGLRRIAALTPPEPGASALDEAVQRAVAAALPLDHIALPRELTAAMRDRIRHNGGTAALAFALAAWDDIIAVAEGR